MWATWTGLINRHTLVEELLSSVTSPAFSELAIVIEDNSIHLLPSDVTLFRTLRTMNEARSFRLVFLAEVVDRHPPGGMEGVRQSLVGALGLVTAKGWLDFLDSPPDIRTARLPSCN